MRYFFDQDDSCHWYLIPEDMRDLWRMVSEKMEMGDFGLWDDFEFDQYRIDGGPESYSFTDPKEVDR